MSLLTELALMTPEEREGKIDLILDKIYERWEEVEREEGLLGLTKRAKEIYARSAVSTVWNIRV